jgi:hypothetical protein
MSAAVNGGFNIHNGPRLSQCRQPSLEVSTSPMGTGFPNVGSRHWRSQHPQWAQAFPMSAAVSGGLNIHNGHRLSQCRQPSLEVSTSTMVTGFPNVGSRQWGLNIHNSQRLPSVGSVRLPSIRHSPIEVPTPTRSIAYTVSVVDMLRFSSIRQLSIVVGFLSYVRNVREHQIFRKAVT